MKKIILTFLVTTVASIGINQLLNSTTVDTKANITENLDINQNTEIIEQLNHEYYTKSEAKNNLIKNNLINSITLSDENIIIINYQNLLRNLYQEEIYQLILSSKFLDSLKILYETKVISFNSNSHINFDYQSKVLNNDLWTEYHWYWFAWWKLHLSYNAVTKIIAFVASLGGLSVSTIAKISEFIAGLITSVTAVVVAAVIAGFIVVSYAILLTYSNHIPGCWLGILGALPGFGWGSN